MANITRYSPFDDLFNEFSRGFWVKPLAMPAGAELSIKVDVKEDEKSFTVRADIPGTVEGNPVFTSPRSEVSPAIQPARLESDAAWICLVT